MSVMKDHQAAVLKAATVPEGMALVPLKPTRAMDRIMEEEGWQWADLLAASEAITEEQYEGLSNTHSIPATSDGWPQRLASLMTWPVDLHDDTKRLVIGFAAAMACKLSAAERKYGYSNGWTSRDWMYECRSKLIEHLLKGDPRDVANYCAFLWWHGESTVAPSLLAAQTEGEQFLPIDHFTKQDEGRRRECGCGWSGPASEAVMCGSVGPLCPECRETTEASIPAKFDPVQALLEILGHTHPFALPREEDTREKRYERLRKAFCAQQPWPVPDQACIVWRADIMEMEGDLIHKQAYFDCMKAKRESAQSEESLLPLEQERSHAEQAYTVSTFDYERNPVGSKEWALYWAGWLARSTLKATAQSEGEHK